MADMIFHKVYELLMSILNIFKKPSYPRIGGSGPMEIKQEHKFNF
jgi:hypothetical protein